MCGFGRQNNMGDRENARRAFSKRKGEKPMGTTLMTPPAAMPPTYKDEAVSTRIDAATKTKTQKPKSDTKKPKHIKRKHKAPQ
jgi:hypothetical protein